MRNLSPFGFRTKGAGAKMLGSMVTQRLPCGSGLPQSKTIPRWTKRVTLRLARIFYALSAGTCPNAERRPRLWVLSRTGGAQTVRLGIATRTRRCVTKVFVIFGLGLAGMWLSVSAGISDATNFPTRTLVVLGDSLGAGYGVEPEEAWPTMVQSNILRADLPVVVVNASVSGDTTAGGLRRLDWQLKRPIHILLIELGGNDGLRGLPPENTRSNLVAIITRTRAKNPQVEVVLAGMKMPPSMSSEYAEKFGAVFPGVAQEMRTTFIPGFLAGVWGVPELNQADQIHPTPQGHALVASNVWNVLEPLLRKK